MAATSSTDVRKKLKMGTNRVASILISRKDAPDSNVNNVAKINQVRAGY